MDDYAADMLQKLTQVRLDCNTMGGMEGYISKFEEVVPVALEEARQPLTKVQKNTFFLHNIHDCDFSATKDICF
jgi:hypothetical protein